MGAGIHPPLQPLRPSIGVPVGDIEVPCSAPEREGGQRFLFNFHILPPYF